MAVSADALGPVLLVEDCNVVVDEEGQVIRNQILPRHSQIERIEVSEFATELLEIFLGDVRVGWELFGFGKNVFPNLIGQLLGLDVQQARFASIQRIICVIRRRRTSVQDNLLCNKCATV